MATQASCALIPQDCNLMYAPSILTIALAPATVLRGTWTVNLDMVHGNNSDLEDGDYEFVMVRQEVGDSMSVLSSDSDIPFEVMVDEDPSTGEIRTIDLWGVAPETVDVTLRGDDGLIADGAFTPDYAVSEPNGDGCGERYLGTISLPITL